MYIFNNFILKIMILVYAFKASANILRGPLSDETEASDELDGEREDIDTDLERLEPRSDEDDTYVQMMSLYFCFVCCLKAIKYIYSSKKRQQCFSHLLNSFFSYTVILEFSSIWYLEYFLCYMYSS